MNSIQGCWETEHVAENMNRDPIKRFGGRQKAKECSDE